VSKLGDKRDYYSMMRFVKVHDVILLKKEQLVYCQNMPSYFTENGSPYSTDTANGRVKIGVPVKRPVTSNFLRAKIAEVIQDLFLYYRLNLQHDIMNRFLAHQIKELPDESFLVPEGLYRIEAIQPERTGRKIYCKTYRPSETRPDRSIYFFLETTMLLTKVSPNS